MVKIAITDNRTSLNIADNASDWTSDKSPADETAEFYEGVESVADQASNSNFEIYDTITLVDLSGVTIYHLFKDVLIDTLANGGVQMIVGDGTDRGGYITGGSDQPLFPLFNFWAMNRLDTTKLPASPVVQAGDGVPDFTQITQLGYGTIHANKSVGSIDNFFIDELSYIANGLRAVEIIGGTSGTPETLADIAGDDITDGIGLFNNPKGSDYGIYGSVGWGDDGGASDSYFQDTIKQIFIDGRGMDVGNMDQVMLAEATQTQSFVLVTCQVIGLVDSADDEARANWEFNVTNHNIAKVTGSLFIKSGTISLPTIDNTNKFFNNNTFVDCGIITARTVNFENNFIVLPDTQGLLISSDSAQIDGCTFDLIGGTGIKDSLVIDTPGTYNFDGQNYFGANGTTLFDINNTSAGLVTVNITGSDNPPTEANSRNTGGGSLSIVVTQTATVNDVTASNEEFLGMYRSVGADSVVVDKDQFSSHATNNVITDTTFDITITIPADTPATGTLKLIKKNADGSVQSEVSHSYTSYSGVTFSGLSPALTVTYDGSDRAFVPYIEKTVTTDPEIYNYSFVSTRNIVIVWRKVGFKEFKIAGQLSSTGYITGIVKTRDPTVNLP